jgi:anti-sigma B factor antagonist
VISRRPQFRNSGDGSLELTESLVGDVRVVTATGDVDLSTSERFGATLQRLAGEPGGPIIVDLTTCDFIDSSGLAAILHAAGLRSDFSIVGGTGAPSEVLQMTAIDQTIPVHDTLEEAIQAAGGKP